MDDHMVELWKKMKEEANPHVKFKDLLNVVIYILATQRGTLLAVRDLLKDKESLNEAEFKAVKDAMNGLASGSGTVQLVFETLLRDSYKVN